MAAVCVPGALVLMSAAWAPAVLSVPGTALEAAPVPDMAPFPTGPAAAVEPGVGTVARPFAPSLAASGEPVPGLE
ncbi:hypothetical protein Aca07nite_27010 [Actinoplanes capillaceus]|uniref:Uncharacterized protein n=1 Tax=Actinoplanes campanulatus TaxID=113559 RepID=A0ABQ3WGR7_9ACTN|nr:hypothetical protein Aca07nite_27010 [Actinoplanes capillaceus]